MNLNEVMEMNSRAIMDGYIVRDGYKFQALTYPFNVFDALVISDLRGCSVCGPSSAEELLERQIALVNQMQLEKAIIYTYDLSFLKRCPSLKYLCIWPLGDDLTDGFDFSPLYDMPEIKYLDIATEYGSRLEHCSSIDYSQIHGLEMLRIEGQGHMNYSKSDTLRSLALTEQKIVDFFDVSCSPVLDSISLSACKLKSMRGIKQYTNLKYLYLGYDRTVSDISELYEVRDSLKVLRIEKCPKIRDFSVLKELNQLEHLELIGNNVLENLDFIQKLGNLQTFIFDVNIKNGDLTPCLSIPNVRLLKNRRHYNLQEAELPKADVDYNYEDIEVWRRIDD